MLVSTVRVGAFASANGLPSAETDLRWADQGADLRAGDGGSPQLPTGWGVCVPGGVSECLHVPAEDW